ncbi:hypothetical protein ABEI22_13970 [Erwinia billingiae]|uniref:DUF4145 domain-containing protein n=1 Tax=Erwinia billingiae TaxID=182337 RepID=UPI003209B008
MTRLRDMEELLADVVDVDLKEYMREALTCYMTGANRACVVLSFIAIFEDLFKKLDGMAATNSTAKSIFDEISKKRDEQKVYENDLLNKLKSEKIISDIDADFLNVLRTLRNKAAHPSGHKPTAEEARYVYSETIGRFLSKPVLSTTQVADEILSKLKNAYLFPTSNIQEHSQVVNEGVNTLHHDGYAYLIRKLISFVNDTNEQVKLNAKRYLLGLSFKPLNDDVLGQIKKLIVVECSSDDGKRLLLMECISTNANLLKGLDSIVYLRLNKMVEETFSKTTSSDQHAYLRHPVQIINSIIELDKSEIDKYFKKVVGEIIGKYYLSPLLIKYSSKKEWVKISVIKNIYDNAGSTTFADANHFAKTAWNHDAELAGLMSDLQCFELIAHVCDASIWGAFESEIMVKGKFNNIQKVKIKALKAIDNESESCQDILSKVRPGFPALDDFKSEYL